MTAPETKKKRWGMIIDLDRCIGCQTCSVACKIKNNLADDIWWNRVLTVGGNHIEVPAGDAAYPQQYYLPVSCQHCENAPCVKVCPTGAAYQREDGVVLIDYNKCIGCRDCIQACPYGVRIYNEQAPLYNHIDFQLGSVKVDPRYKGIVEKCTFCVDRIDEGLEPMCVEVCPTRARFFGDLNDEESVVSKINRETETKTLHPELGTKPAVHYITPSRKTTKRTGLDTIEPQTVGSLIKEFNNSL